jgi:hypothetical protein
MASFELRDYVEAVRALGGALKEQRRALTDEQRRQVQQLLARAETFVGRFALRLQPPDATLAVDDRPTTREADGTLLLPFGHHRVIARCATCLPSEKELEVDVVGGERRDPRSARRRAGGRPGRQTLGARRQRHCRWWSIDARRRHGREGGLLGAALSRRSSAGRRPLVGQPRPRARRPSRGRRSPQERIDADGPAQLAIGMTVDPGAVAVTTDHRRRRPRRRDATPSSTVACDLGRETISCAIRLRPIHLRVPSSVGFAAASRAGGDRP